MCYGFVLYFFWFRILHLQESARSCTRRVVFYIPVLLANRPSYAMFYFVPSVLADGDLITLFALYDVL